MILGCLKEAFCQNGKKKRSQRELWFSFIIIEKENTDLIDEILYEKKFVSYQLKPS